MAVVSSPPSFCSLGEVRTLTNLAVSWTVAFFESSKSAEEVFLSTVENNRGGVPLYVGKQEGRETEKHYGTRGENANFECQHCKAAARKTLLYGSPVKLQRKRELEKLILNASEPLKRREHYTTAVRIRFLSANTAKP